MTHLIEKAFYFSKKEFLVLLALDGIRRIYSFQLPGQQDIGRGEAITLLYSLVKRGIAGAGQDQEKPEIIPEVKEILAKIRDAVYGLTVMPGTCGRQQICYLGKRGFVLTELTGQTDEIRIRSISCEQLRELLLEGEGLPSMPFQTEAEGKKLAQYSPQVAEELEELTKRAPVPMEESLHQWTEQMGAECAWELSVTEAQKAVKRLCFLEGGMNSWVVWQTGETEEAAFDSLERREMLLNWLLEDVQKGE